MICKIRLKAAEGQVSKVENRLSQKLPMFSTPAGVLAVMKNQTWLLAI